MSSSSIHLQQSNASLLVGSFPSQPACLFPICRSFRLHFLLLLLRLKLCPALATEVQHQHNQLQYTYIHHTPSIYIHTYIHPSQYPLVWHPLNSLFDQVCLSHIFPSNPLSVCLSFVLLYLLLLAYPTTYSHLHLLLFDKFALWRVIFVVSILVGYGVWGMGQLESEFVLYILATLGAMILV